MEHRPTSGERVRYWRRRTGLTLIQLSERAEISKSALSRIERDQQDLRSKQMEKLVAIFGITVRQFWGDAVKVEEARAS